MKINFKRCDLTPTRPMWQGGYIQRTTFFERVHDPIKSTTFVLDNCGKKMAWVTCDFSGIQKDLADKIIGRINSKGLALSEDDIILAGTHTHSGPMVGSYYDRVMDEEYIESVVETVASSVVELWDSEKEDVEVQYSNCLIDGLYSNRNDKNKWSDKLVHFISFNKDGKPVCLWYTMAHHCTILGPNFMECSADLFGELRNKLEEEFGCPVFMAQGNAGDMGNKQYRRANVFSEVEYQANMLIDQIRKKRSAWTTLELTEFNVRKYSYRTEYDVDASVYVTKKADFEKRLETETDFDTIKLLKTGIGAFERKIKAGSGHVVVDMPYKVMDFGKDLQIVLIPGELGSVLGQRIKDASKAKVCCVWGYVNPCHLGYMVEKEAYEGFSQEANVTNYPAGVPDLFIEDIVKNL